MSGAMAVVRPCHPEIIHNVSNFKMFNKQHVTSHKLKGKANIEQQFMSMT